MAMQQVTFEIPQGSTWNRNIFYKRGGVAVNLTGFTARMWLKRLITDTVPAFEFTTANGRITIDGALGKITLALTDEETLTLSGTYVYDLKLAPATNADFRLFQGKIIVSPQVTP